MYYILYFVQTFIYYKIKTASSTNVSTKYAQLGSNVILKCDENTSINAWQDIASKNMIEVCQDFNETAAIIRRTYITQECHLMIRNFTLDDAHTYRCLTNKGYTDVNMKLLTLSTNIRVLEADGMNTITVVDGIELNITCKVDCGEPQGKLYWSVNNTVVAAGGPESLVYSIISPKFYDGENFTCASKNSKTNNTISITVQLSIITQPEVRISAASNIHHTRKGVKVILTCEEISGQPVDEYEWFNNNLSIPVNNMTIEVHYVEPENRGNYTCFAKNKAGLAESESFNVDVLCYPDKPTILGILSMEKDIFVSWKRGPSCYSKLQFHIEYRQQSSEIWMSLSANDSNREIQRIHLTGFNLSTTYIIRMYASSKLERSVYTAEYNITTTDMKAWIYGFKKEYIILTTLILFGIIFGSILTAKCFIERKRTPIDQNNDLDQHDDDNEEVLNDLHHSIHNLVHQDGATGRDTDMYSSIDRQPHIVGDPNVSYNITKPVVVLGKQKTDHGFIQGGSWTAFERNTPEQNKLHYTEILFEPTTKNKTFVIRGANNRTPYVEIDFDAHAEPLPVSCDNSPAPSSILNGFDEEGI